ncbi:hypothetical protein J7K44_00870, partial [bacterium]|nr:hypothetical protein [bacterium]
TTNKYQLKAKRERGGWFYVSSEQATVTQVAEEPGGGTGGEGGGTGIPAPTDLYVNYPSAQTPTSTIDFPYSTPFFSAINNHGETVSYVHIQVALSSDTNYTNPVWDSGDICIYGGVNDGYRTPDIFYGVGNPPTGLLEAGQNYIWRIRTKNGLEYSEWSSDGTINMTTGALTGRFYAGSGDGVVGYYGADWSTAHNATIGTGFCDTCTVDDVRTSWNASLSRYEINRAFFPINTSLIPDDATITEALLKVSVQGWIDNEDNGSLGVVHTTQATTTGLSEEDYDQCGAINNPPEGAIRVNVADIVSGGINSWVLNATGMSWISKTGWTRLGIRHSYDLDNLVPTGENYVGIRTADQIGSCMPIGPGPYLEVTYQE